jgi:hypothetical protein
MTEVEEIERRNAETIARNQRIDETHERITYLEFAIADIYEQLLTIQEEQPND